MWKTKNIYGAIYHRKYPVPEKYLINVPDWRNFDWFAESWVSRLGWIVVYGLVYWLLDAPLWCYFVLLPLQAVVGPLHGAIINWFAHKLGYINYATKDTSRNIWPIDWLMWGEGLHNNHHTHPGRWNFAIKWFEFDPMWVPIKILSFLGVIRLNPIAA